MKMKYFAYGSNLHPLRLVERVPSASLLRMACLNRHRLSFDKQSIDGSGKCTIAHTGKTQDQVYGAVYEIAASEKIILDEYEGDGYHDIEINIRSQGMAFECFTYVARDASLQSGLLPYDWYKGLVILGAEYLQLPDEYVDKIRRMTAIPDPHQPRESLHAELLNRMSRYVSGG